MTRTEDRLTDALAAMAGTVSEQTLRPLQAGPAAPVTPAGPAVAAVAAVAVLAAVGLGLAVARLTLAGPGFADRATAAGPPPYYVDLEHGFMLTVRATATGRVTDAIRPPARWTGTDPQTTAVAAADDGRVFVVAYYDIRHRQTGLYRFSLTSSGRVTGFSPIPHGVLPGLLGIALAVSPDGARVAISGVVSEKPSRRVGIRPIQTRIVVIRLRTGRHRVWQGGPTRSRWQFTVPSLSWAPGGRSLVYLAQWCSPEWGGVYNVACAGPPPVRAPVAQVREFPATGRGGRIGGRVLLRESPRYPRIVQALMPQNGRLVAMVWLWRDRRLSLVTFAVPGGRALGVSYRGRAPNPYLAHTGPLAAALTADGSGRYLILNQFWAAADGWVRHGRLIPLAHGRGAVWSTAW